MFWTNRVPNSSVQAEDDESENGASWHVNNLALFDYFSVTNALGDGPSIDATVSYRLRWAGGGTRLRADDGTHFHFEGRQTTATIQWSAHEAGFSFRSDPSPSTQSTNFAQVGQERNGVFYSADD
ncbi:MAG TPA: hypothetical protein VGR77_05150 [Candidatus Dormibacteraeota bacterium]|nr:hypothetical protein [Candidatus Dormibacteraeota bacterium]